MYLRARSVNTEGRVSDALEVARGTSEVYVIVSVHIPKRKCAF